MAPLLTGLCSLKFLDANPRRPWPTYTMRLLLPNYRRVRLNLREEAEVDIARVSERSDGLSIPRFVTTSAMPAALFMACFLGWLQQTYNDWYKPQPHRSRPLTVGVNIGAHVRSRSIGG